MIDLGLIDYQTAWDFQEKLLKKTTDQKVANKNNQTETLTSNYLIFCEHEPVYTLGKSGKKEHLLLSESELEEKGISYFAVNRGGDITHHAPGQLVVYPIFDLDHFFHDIHRYLRTLEEAVILTLADFGILAGRYSGYTGVWLDANNEKARKICAMGVKCSRWVTMHGLALNVNNDLSLFNYIVPCGIDDKAVTSIHQELGTTILMDELKLKLGQHIISLFTSKDVI
jgi:lipoyl(octanoyl) transferase